MILTSGGDDGSHQLGIEPTTQNRSGRDCVSKPTPVPFDISGVQCVSGGFEFSVILKGGSVFAAGNDTEFAIGSSSRQIYNTFTEVKICDEQISWLACGEFFTLYLIINGKVILCSQKAIGDRIQVQLDKKAVSVFAGQNYGCVIDEEGVIHILDRIDPHKPPQRVSLEAKAIDVVCCQTFMCVQTLDGRVFANGKLNNGSQDFAEVSAFNGIKIEKISGRHDTIAALASDGRVFVYGSNSHGQLGNQTTNDNYSSFILANLKEEAKDVSCSDHILFLTRSNNIYGCGNNECYQIFKKINIMKVLTPILTTTIEADHVITCSTHSFILSGTGKLENPAKAYFLNAPQQEVNLSADSSINEQPTSNSNINNETSSQQILTKLEEQSQKTSDQQEKSESLLSMRQTQSQSISKVVEACSSLQQQNESNKEEVRKVREEMEQMSEKLDVVVKYIKDQDFY